MWRHECLWPTVRFDHIAHRIVNADYGIMWTAENFAYPTALLAASGSPYDNRPNDSTVIWQVGKEQGVRRRNTRRRRPVAAT
jgi:hypothetical protein